MIRPSYLLVALLVGPSSFADDTVELAERPNADRVLETDLTLEVDGTLKTRGLGGLVNGLKLEVRSKHRYRARRLAAAGRDALALREVRYYDVGEARIDVEGNTTTSDLHEDRRTFVADGLRSGLRVHAPDFALSSKELDLLDVPGDPLAIVATLPGDERSVGDEWPVPEWAAQMLAGVEALEKADVACKFVSLEKGLARIDVAGTVKGAAEGTIAELALEGHYLFDVDGGYVSHLELTQRDERTIGPVSPGLDVKAKIVFDRKPTKETAGVSAAYARGLPLETDPRSLLIVHPLPWNAELLLDRTWHVFHQTRRAAFLRCVRSGSLVAQCNVTRIDSAGAGKHTDVERFRDDVARSLGDQLKRIVSAERVDVGDDRFVYRVTAVGENEIESGDEPRTIPMTWSYYLVAAPSGRQLSFMFVMETELREKLAGADEAVVRASQFVESKVPTRAATRER